MAFSASRITAMARRHLILQIKESIRMFDIIFWPLLDMVIWGFAGLGMGRSSDTYISMLFLPLLGSFFWGQALARTSTEITLGLLEEIWTKNISGIFSSPLTFTEWIVSLMLVSILRISFIAAITTIAIYIFFGCNILLFGLWLIPLFFSLVVSGWTLGFLCTGMIMRFGPRLQTFAWAIGWALAPLCGVFYSISVLPVWMQKVGSALPMTYIFKAIHQYMINGVMPIHDLITSALLNALFFTLSCTFLAAMIKKARTYGLARLEVDG